MEIKMVVSEVKMEDGKYVGYVRGKQVTKQNSHEKACLKTALYLKGQK